MPDPEKNGWNEWSRHVLKELERLNDTVGALEKSNAKLHTSLAVLKHQAGVWGLVAGAIPGVLAAIAMLLIWMANS